MYIYIYIYIYAVNNMTSINDEIIVISTMYWFARNSKNDWKISQSEIKIKLVFSFENYSAAKATIRIDIVRIDIVAITLE